MLSAINYCHSNNIVHRDLKPENLLLDDSDDSTHVTIIDFGYAGYFTPGDKLHTRYGASYYIAPEVIKKSYDNGCDIWSCGVILYIMLCGYPPFNGPSDKKIIEAVLAGQYSLDEPEWHTVSDEAKDLICKMLCYNPEQRITARDALCHQWIKKNSQVDSVTAELANRTIKNFQAFKGH